jgi:hypothetical protein
MADYNNQPCDHRTWEYDSFSFMLLLKWASSHDIICGAGSDLESSAYMSDICLAKYAFA